ncbi:protein SlyX [Pseudomonas cichorii]|nr:protein SlyX [Pseudomonas cichorii]GFM85905.1 protein SlyX [Pseudomonas cichorii]
MIMNLDERVMELESRLTFQEDTLQALNDVLVIQRRELDRLQLQMTAMLKRQEEMGSQFDTFVEDAPPPHY